MRTYPWSRSVARIVCSCLKIKKIEWLYYLKIHSTKHQVQLLPRIKTSTKLQIYLAKVNWQTIWNSNSRHWLRAGVWFQFCKRLEPIITSNAMCTSLSRDCCIKWKSSLYDAATLFLNELEIKKSNGKSWKIYFN